MGNTICGCLPLNATPAQRQPPPPPPSPSPPPPQRQPQLLSPPQAPPSQTEHGGASSGVLEVATPTATAAFPGPSQTEHDDDSPYIFLDVIESGQSTVRRVSNKETGEILACKSIRIVPGTWLFDDEYNITLSLRGNKNIVELKDIMYEQEQPDQLHIIMELCEGGELLDGVIRIGQRYTEKKAAGLFRQIVKIISTCHSARVIHRDLKPENLMFSTMEEDSPIKAIDFGIATFFEPGETFQSVTGAFPYCAPEMLERKHGHEVDIWSAGVILCVLLTGSPPFMKDNSPDTDSLSVALEEHRNGYIDYRSSPWSSVSSSAVHLLKRMLKVDPKARISAANILKHPWVREDGNIASDAPMDVAIIRRMKRFRAMTKFGRVPLQVVAETLSEEEIMGLKEMFKSVDTGNLGVIGLEQLMDGLNKWSSHLEWRPRFSDSEVKLFVESDGRINYDEFMAKLLNKN